MTQDNSKIDNLGNTDKTSNSGNTGSPNTDGKLNFKCSDVGPKSCDWQVSGNSEEEILPQIEQHGREEHELTLNDELKSKVRGAIQQKKAA